MPRGIPDIHIRDKSSQIAIAADCHMTSGCEPKLGCKGNSWRTQVRISNKLFRNALATAVVMKRPRSGLVPLSAVENYSDMLGTPYQARTCVHIGFSLQFSFNQNKDRE